jgi:hypothetical protein
MDKAFSIQDVLNILEIKKEQSGVSTGNTWLEGRGKV